MTKAEEFVELLANFYGKFLEGSASAVETLAIIEEHYPDEYKSFKDFNSNPDSINELMKKLTVEKQTTLLRMLLQSGKFAGDFANLLNLNIEQKKTLAKSLREFCVELEKSFKENIKSEEPKK